MTDFKAKTKTALDTFTYISDHMANNKNIPDYIELNNLQFKQDDYIDALKRFLTYINTNNKIPQTVTFKNGSIIETKPTPTPTPIPEPQPTPEPETTVTTRPVWIVSDNIYISNSNPNADKNNVQNIIDKLSKLGVTAKAYGYGPNKNLECLDNKTVEDNAIVVEIAGGADAASIWEKAGTWYQNLKKNRKNIIVFMDTSLRITGLNWLPRAHDDDYSPASFTGLEHPDQYLINNGFDFIEGISKDDINPAVQFIYKHSILDSSEVTKQCQDVDQSNDKIQVILEKFQDMISRFNIFKSNNNGNEPKLIYLNSGGCGAYVSNSRFHDMFDRYTAFYNSHNKTYPTYVWTVNDTTPQIISSDVTDLDKFEKLFGVRPTTPQELYDWSGDHLIWIEYYNDGMTNSAIEDQIANNGVAKCNCTDQAQFLKPILEDMDFEVQFCNGNVKCSDSGWYGHVWLRYRKKGTTDWAYFDSVAITTPGLSRPLGNLCCIGGTSNVSIDDNWLYERDQHI